MSQPQRIELRINPSEAMAVKAVIERSPPDVLYHYTTRKALHDILESRSVVASHIRYLNDAQEMAFAIHRAREVLDTRQTTTDADEKLIYNELQRYLQYLEPQSHVFVFSMSHAGDLLSQWRAYCRPSDGYAIGFDGQALAAHARTQQSFMAPCVYEEDEQRRLVEQLIDDSVRQFRAKRSDGMSADDSLLATAALFLIAFHIVAPVLKDLAFKEEREWRLISTMYGMGHPNIRYRAGSTLLVPYITLTLAAEKQALPIREVVVGPTAHNQLEAQAVLGLLVRVGAASTNVRWSRVPYRT